MGWWSVSVGWWFKWQRWRCCGWWNSGEIERETLPDNDCGLFSVHEFLGCRWREFITALPSPYLRSQKQMVTRHSELQGLNSSNTMTFSITRDPIKRVISAFKTLIAVLMPAK